jgi:hypothetical protein
VWHPGGDEGLEIVVCLLVGEEEEQAQEFAVDTVGHACRQKRNLSVAAIGSDPGCRGCVACRGFSPHLDQRR